MKTWYLILENKKLYDEMPDNWIVHEVTEEKPTGKMPSNMMYVEMVRIIDVNAALTEQGVDLYLSPSNKQKLELRPRGG